MRARCHWRWSSLLRRFGVTGTIVACTGALALAGSPQLHELLHPNGARPAHSCAITLPNAGKCVKAIESPATPFWAEPTLVLLGPLRRPSPTWVPKLFLEACRCEHGPPALS